MHCPYCKNEDTKVLDSRVADDGGSIRRRRTEVDGGVDEVAPGDHAEGDRRAEAEGSLVQGAGWASASPRPCTLTPRGHGVIVSDAA